MRGVARRIGFVGAFLCVAAGTAALVVAGARLASSPGPATAEAGVRSVAGEQVSLRTTAAGCRVPEGTSVDAAAAVRALFLRTAVLRLNAKCSYELVTPELRQGMTRREWATGNIPIQPFPTEEPETLHVETKVREARRAKREVLIALHAADLGQYVFEVVLVERGGRWLVSYWAPAGPGAFLGDQPYGLEDAT